MRAEIEAMPGTEITKNLDLGLVFWEILNNKYYKPKK